MRVISIKELCLLHERDPVGTPRRALDDVLHKHEYHLTWTDLQEFLQDKSVYHNVFLREWKAQQRVDGEKYEYALAALDFLSKRRRERPKGLKVQAEPSVYDVVWNFEWLERSGHVFRGQFNAALPLRSTLFRRDTDGGELDVKMLMERIQATEAFLAKLRQRQNKLFGKELDEDSLLAIARHSGFPAPLLDFTRSLRIAAFFATRKAEELDSRNEVIGVIHHISDVLDHRFFEQSSVGGVSIGKSEYYEHDGKEFAIDPGAVIGLRLLELAGLRFGRWRFITPDLPDKDNRIARQRALFLAGFEGCQLTEYSLDAIYFRQEPGEVFEDKRVGADRTTLLPEGTDLQKLADSVKRMLPATNIHPLIGSEKVYREGIIGSAGSLLYSVIEDGRLFFGALGPVLERVGIGAVSTVAGIMGGYFRACQFEAAVGPIPKDGQPALKPIAQAVSQLASWSAAQEELLWNSIFPHLQGGPADGVVVGPVRDRPQLHPTDDRQRIALACALYLAGWEHLRHVDGNKARELIVVALRTLEPSS